MFNSNYSIIEQGFAAQYQANVTVYSHNITKAKIVYIDNKDTNCLFAAVFKTPSWGHKGVAHILEHSVLCGSAKYPHKELFGEVVKTSIATFINAMTFPDKTMYPVTSNNQKDFYNLQSVYLDSVFAPQAMGENGQKIFEQEGHHLEFDNQGKLIRKGVVYNEMKGAYSTCDHWLLDAYNAGLYPDTCYSQSSGGFPSSIGKLTYSEFRDFYTKFYHPSNSTIFLTGSKITQANFDLIDEYLSQYEYLQTDSLVETLTPDKRTVANCAISYQPAFESPRTIEQKYPDKKSALIWATSNGNSKDLHQVFLHKIVRRLLIINSTSPLRLALESSGLGSNFYYGDSDDDALAQIYNPIGLLGVDENNLDKVTDLINLTLTQIVKKGFDQEEIESIINSLSLNLRQNSLYPNSPNNLGLIVNILNSNLYGASVLESLNYDLIIDQIKSELTANPQTLTQFIQKYWIDNPHKVIIKMIGGPDFLEQIKQKELAELEQLQASLTQEQVQEIKDKTAKLNQWQSSEQTPEVLSSIPKLDITDIPLNQTRSNCSQISIDNYDILTSPLDSSGLNYIGLALDTSNLSDDQLQLLPLYIKCLTELDTDNYTSSQIKKYLDKYTGGLTKQIINANLNDKSGVIHKYYIQGTTLTENSANLSGMIAEIVYKTKFNLDIKSKLKQLITEKKSLLREGFLRGGHGQIFSFLASNFDRVSKINQAQSGYKQILYLEKLELEFETIFDQLLAQLQTIQKITNSVKPLVNLGGNLEDLNKVATDITKLLESQTFGASPISHSSQIPPLTSQSDQDIEYDTQVNYVGQLVSLPIKINLGAALIAQRYLVREYLWNKVRVQGGAYGASAVLRPTNDIFGLVSYRDPNQSATYGIYDTVGDTVANLELTPEDLNKLKIGTVGSWDNHSYPDELIISNLINHLINQSDEYRQSVRDQILLATIEDINQFGEIINQASSTKLRGMLKAKKSL
ncbi:MAG: insulinase family protein [Candidatus Parcubacteria bacterium]|nr:insulinase family protein [Candidatus Paceibacterota bacterium]